jgi:hypothetical protein
MTPAEKRERCRMALAEAGYPNAWVVTGPTGDLAVITAHDDPSVDVVPVDIAYRAMALAVHEPVDGNP